MKQLSSMFLYANLFIALAASALCWQTYQLLNEPVSVSIIVVIFLSTLAGYGLHVYFQCWHMQNDEYKYWLISNRRLLLFLSLISITAIAWITYSLQTIWKPLTIAAAIYAGYSIPILLNKQLSGIKYLGLLKPFILSAGWAYTTVFIAHPAYDKPSIIISIYRLLSILPLALLFDYRDRMIDKENKIYTFSNILGDNFTRNAVFGTTALMLIAGFAGGKMLQQDALFYGAGVQALLLTMWDPMGLSDKSAKYYLTHIDGLLFVSPIVSLIFEFI
jgi:hypothetical protein